MDKIITDEFIATLDSNTTYTGLLRDIMMTNDPDKYFDKAWNCHWGAMDIKEFERIILLNPDIENHLEIMGDIAIIK